MNSRPSSLPPRLVPAAGAAVLSCLMVALCAQSANAGTVYVPLPGSLSVGATAYAAQVVLVNRAGQPKSADTLFLPVDTDGTDRDGLTPGLVTVLARRTAIAAPGSGAGLLEIDGSADLDSTARLVATAAPGALGAVIPVVGSSNRAAAGSTVVIPGFGAKGDRSSDLLVVNLADEGASCSVEFLRADGTQAVAKATLTFKALSLRRFADVFASLGAGVDIADAHAKVSCDEPFYAYGILRDTATGELATLWPATPGSSTLVPPGQGPECAEGATCFEAPGLVHKPTQGTPVGRVTFNPPTGTVDRFRLTMDVTVDDFFPGDPAGKHLLYWFVINNNKDMPGMLYFRGPEQGGALARHGMGLTHPQKKKLQNKAFKAKVGTTYRVVNDYDMKSGIFRISITNLDTDAVEGQLTGTPNVASYKMPASAKMIVDMGFPEGVVVDEVPSYDWLYQNLFIEVFYQ